MALTLTLEPEDAFYVIPPDGKPHQRYVLADIASPEEFTLHYETEGRMINVSDERGVEIYPEVVASAGINGTYQIAKIVLRADREIKILRESIYREWFG